MSAASSPPQASGMPAPGAVASPGTLGEGVPSSIEDSRHGAPSHGMPGVAERPAAAEAGHGPAAAAALLLDGSDLVEVTGAGQLVSAVRPAVGSLRPGSSPDETSARFALTSSRPLAPPPPRRRMTASATGEFAAMSAGDPALAAALVTASAPVPAAATDDPATDLASLVAANRPRTASVPEFRRPLASAVESARRIPAAPPASGPSSRQGTTPAPLPSGDPAHSSSSRAVALVPGLSGAPSSLNPATPQPRAATSLPPGPASRAGTSEDLPKQFGKYTLLRKLASGGMAELFLALQHSMAGFEKLVVVKRILPKMNQDAGFIEMLLNEARVAASLSHPNIVQTFDVGEVDGLFYIAMEHIQGEDIRAVVRQLKKLGRTEFPLAHAIEIIGGLCAGLAYAHERGDLDGTPLNIVHRDISPQNIVVTFSGDVKVVDFGIAKSDRKFASETGLGHLKGKIPYMSPEQARGEELDGRSDIFSVGVMLFELTTGRRLFKGDSEFATLKMICESPYPLPSHLVDNYPIELEAIVMRALAKDRASRFQSARDLQTALETFSRERRIVTSSVALSEFMRDIFADELAAGREAILSDKHLAAEVTRLRMNSNEFPSAPPRPLSSSAPAITSTLLSMQAPREAVDGMTEPGNTPATVVERPAANSAVSASVPAADAARPRPARRGWWWAAAGLAIAAGGLLAVKANTRTDLPTAPGPGTSAPTPTGQLRVESMPPGASIWVDGNLQSATTPTTIDGLPLGRDLQIKVTKDGFERSEATLRIDASGAPASKTFTLEHGQLVIEWTAEPKNATVTIDNLLAPGHRAADLTSDADHVLVASAPGYVDERITVRGEAHDVKHVDFRLHYTPVSGPLVLPVPSSSAMPSAAMTARPGASALPSAPPQPPVVGKGTLNVAASGGWCNVAVDGVGRGATPVAGIELSSGPHSVTCTTAEGKTVSAGVQVPVDGTARQKFAL